MALTQPPSRHPSNENKGANGNGPTWPLQLGWALVLALAGILAGLVMGFVWATARDYATLSLNGAEIRHLTAQVHHLQHQVAVLSLHQPHGNWWLWWVSAPFRRLWIAVHFW